MGLGPSRLRPSAAPLPQIAAHPFASLHPHSSSEKLLGYVPSASVPAERSASTKTCNQYCSNLWSQVPCLQATLAMQLVG